MYGRTSYQNFLDWEVGEEPFYLGKEERRFGGFQEIIWLSCGKRGDSRSQQSIKGGGGHTK